MLSILIPTYNYSIVELVRNVQKQAIIAKIQLNLIVLDDCSKDQEIINDNNLIKELDFCILYKNEKNLGRTASRNYLASKASYNKLLILDADVQPKYDNFISRLN